VKAKFVYEAIKHLKPRTPEEIANLPDPPEPKVYETIDDIYDELNPQQQIWADEILAGRNTIRGLYNDEYWRNGGWNGMMDAISAYMKMKNIVEPSFENFEGLINIDELLINSM
jgi:hypothetical protein